jgi:hypothetical protein
MKMIVNDLISKALVDKTFVGSSYSPNKIPRKIREAYIGIVYGSIDLELHLEFYPDKDGNAILPGHIDLEEEIEII